MAKIVRCPRLPFAQVISEAIEPDALVEQNREGQERRKLARKISHAALAVSASADL